MTGEDENIVHIAPQPDAQGVERRKIANPLTLRNELQRNALTKNLVRFNEFNQTIMLFRPIPRPQLKGPKLFQPRPWTDADDTALIEHLNHRGFKRVGRNLVRDVIDLEARSNAYHPVRDYFGSLRWDGTKRLARLFIDHCGAVSGDDEDSADTTKYIEAVTRAFFISAVARVYQPGVKADCMLVLEGPQGALKSQLLRTLARRDEWFSDSLPHDLESKDARSHLAGLLIVEMSEIAQFRRSEIETVKAFLSCRIDRYRPAYGRTDVSVPRQCVFAGTTNSQVYLRDPTGNRRFWPLRVEAIKIEDVATIVDQLWAEAVVAYHQGEIWWLTPEVEKIAVGEQEGRLETDPWHEKIAAFVETRSPDAWITTADVLDHLGMDQVHRERAHEMRVGAVLGHLQCERKKRRLGPQRKPHWAYRKPRQENEDVDVTDGIE